MPTIALVGKTSDRQIVHNSLKSKDIKDKFVYVRPQKGRQGATLIVSDKKPTVKTAAASREYLQKHLLVGNSAFESGPLTVSTLRQHVGPEVNRNNKPQAPEQERARLKKPPRPKPKKQAPPRPKPALAKGRPIAHDEPCTMIEAKNINGDDVMIDLPPTHSGKWQDANIPQRNVKQTINSFNKEIKEYAAHGILDGNSIIDKTSDLGDEAPLLFRVYMNMEEAWCDDILQNGSVSGKHRTGDGTTAEKLARAENDFKKSNANADSFPDLVKKAGTHKGAGHGTSNFVGTTSNEKYIYGSYSEDYAGKYVFAIAVVADDSDKIYSVEQMDDTYTELNNKHMFGMDSKNKPGDFEKEFLFGGGIKPDRIAYSIKIKLTKKDQGNLFGPAKKADPKELEKKIASYERKLKKAEIKAKGTGLFANGAKVEVLQLKKKIAETKAQLKASN